MSQRDIATNVYTQKLNVIHVDTSNAYKNEAETKHFYNVFQKALLISASDITVVIGEFNSKISKGKCDCTVGLYGLAWFNHVKRVMLWYQIF